MKHQFRPKINCKTQLDTAAHEFKQGGLKEVQVSPRIVERSLQIIRQQQLVSQITEEIKIMRQQSDYHGPNLLSDKVNLQHQSKFQNIMSAPATQAYVIANLNDNRSPVRLKSPAS